MVKGEKDSIVAEELPDLFDEFGVPKTSFPRAERAFWSWVDELEGKGRNTSGWWGNGNGDGNKGNLLRAVFIMRFGFVNGNVPRQDFDKFTKKINSIIPEDSDLFGLFREITEKLTA